ncbi:MAG: CocE/NonD family hydrolase [Mycobacteriales bacterium]|nr:CocE/NonD family hydrolase [Mycobacteriales bacterium]
MRSPRPVLLAAGLALGVVAAALAVPAGAAPTQPATAFTTVVPGPAPAPKVDGSLDAVYTVPTRHGPIALNVVHPTSGGKVLRAHGILTITPYSQLGRNGDASTWVPRGYARMTADTIGTGDSGGCYDYGGKREKETGFDIVQWIAKQPWSAGRLGMRGGSYDGTTATATAVMRPPALATIVPEAAISRWYDYAYSGGIRYTLNNEARGPQGPGSVTDEGLDTPLAFDFGFSTLPPTDVTSPGYAERLAATTVVCDEVEHTMKGYDTTPDYDAFWVERDYAALASKITIPVMVVHNWGDWNVKQDTALRLFNSLTGSKERRLFFGTRWDGHGTPGGTYKATLVAWMDRWVGGVRNGIEKELPTVTTQTSTNEGAAGFLTATSLKTTPLRLGSTGDFQFVRGAGTGTGTAGITVTGSGTESVALADLSPGGHETYAVLTSDVLAQDLRILGSPSVKVSVDSGRTWLTLAVSLVDVSTEGAADVAVTRGWLDTRYEKGLDKQRLSAPGARAHGVTLKPTDYTFTRGHRIALVVSGEQAEWVIPKVYDGTPCATCTGFTLKVGAGTTLTLPVTGSTRALP